MKKPSDLNNNKTTTTVQQHEQYPFVQVPPLAPLNVPPVLGYPTVYPTSMPMAGQYSVTQFQQAQFLFQKDKQTITPEAIKSVKAALASNESEQKTEKKVVYRKAAGQAWADPTLAEWPQSMSH
ncbi:Rna-binding protein [Thalictrum thalictroides]|uniref:Rna-binding protein n=1 Tax=Thalictrum thalictroides TaxID=46969 RepID=A0A7J6VF09_THATH|nr:Rna-binding protein [Thalictrum thalictroides]